MKPLFNRVFIKRIKVSEEVTEAGIIVHHRSDDLDTFLKGTIMSVGGDCTDSIKVGDIVAFRKTVGKEVQIDGEKLLMVRETELEGIWVGVNEVKEN